MAHRTLDAVVLALFFLACAPRSEAGVRLAWYEFDNSMLYGNDEYLHVDQYQGGLGSRADYMRAHVGVHPLFLRGNLDLPVALRTMTPLALEVTGPTSPRLQRKDLRLGTPVEKVDAYPGPSRPHSSIEPFDHLEFVAVENVRGRPARHYRSIEKLKPEGLFVLMEQHGTETWGRVDAWYVDAPPAWADYLAATQAVPTAAGGDTRDPFSRLASTKRGVPVRLEISFEFRGKPLEGTADSLFTMMGMRDGRLLNYRVDMLALDHVDVPPATFVIPSDR